VTLKNLYHLKFPEKVFVGLEGNFRIKMIRRLARTPISQDVEEPLNGKLGLILPHDGYVIKYFRVFSGRREK
jgi:hypothetical protein